eukprot:10600988-Alexandrium_andersonii.AAC.1
MSNLPRPSAPAGTHDVPEVAMGYCFLTKDTSETTLTVLVIRIVTLERSWHTRCCARDICATTPCTKQSQASAGSGAITVSCLRQIMSL